MRVAGRISSGLALAVVALMAAACGPPTKPLPPGTLTLQVTPSAVSVANLELHSATMRLDHVVVLGDTPPPPGPGGPPMGQMLLLDVLGTGATLTYAMLPPGVYSRVDLQFDDVDLEGTWRGTPLSAHLAMFRPGMVDVRSPTGSELAQGQDVAFVLTVNPSEWFGNGILDGAMVMGGQIVCDDQNNPNITDALVGQIMQSFTLQ